MEKSEKWKSEIKRLDKIRLNLGLTSGKIEKRIGINRKQLDRIFACETQPGLGIYLTIKEFLENERDVVFAEVLVEGITSNNAVSKIETIIEKQKVIPEFKEDYQFQNDCDCKLDENGLLRRGKIKCKKSKEEHKF